MRKLLSFFFALAVTVGVSVSAFGGSSPLLGVWRGSSGGTCTPAYVTGDRTASITVTGSSGINGAIAAGVLGNYVNGDFSTNSSGSIVIAIAAGGAAGEWINFDFGTAKLVTEAKYYSQISATQGNWKWQGSPDNVSWTDIGVSFGLGTVATQTQTQLNGNVTSYRYYRLLGDTGSSMDGGIWQEEIEFKQCP